MQQVLCVLLSSDIHPSGSVNRLGGPQKVILATSGEIWVEQSPFGVCLPSTNYPGSNCCYLSVIQFYICILFMKYVQYLQKFNANCFVLL